MSPSITFFSSFLPTVYATQEPLEGTVSQVEEQESAAEESKAEEAASEEEEEEPEDVSFSVVLQGPTVTFEMNL
ncbi:hypothetical protein F5887DRAFT_956909 [Amanita rubescens]|nr:hypothetical protein F5887DRAFT_956909 [Amanita rubescens]